MTLREKSFESMMGKRDVGFVHFLSFSNLPYTYLVISTIFKYSYTNAVNLDLS